MQDHFEDALTSSLAAIRASRLALQDSAKELTTLDTYGRISEELSPSADRDGFFSRMLRDISARGSPKSSPIWKKWRTGLSAEYSARLKSAHHIGEKGSSYWPTIEAQNTVGYHMSGGKRLNKIETEVLNQAGLLVEVNGKKSVSHPDYALNPQWVESIMGLEINVTALDYSVME